MPEEQAFCVLVKIMFDYNLRELFKLGFEALHLRFFQLERLIEVLIQILVSHTVLSLHSLGLHSGFIPSLLGY